MVASVVARYVTPPKMLLLTAHGYLLVGIACIFLSVYHPVAMLILLPLLGSFSDVLLTLGYVWADHYITLFGVIVGLKNMLVTLLFYGREAEAPTYLLSYGDSFREVIFMPALVHAILLCVLTWVMTCYASRKGSRRHRAKVKALNKASSATSMFKEDYRQP